jgi:hypothetical protein
MVIMLIIKGLVFDLEETSAMFYYFARY